MWKPDYLTLTEAKKYLRVPLTDTLDDDEIALAITTASRSADDHCNRQFGKVDTPEQRTYTAYYDSERGLWVVPIDDLAVSAGFTATIDGGSPIDAYTLEPPNAVAEGLVWTHLVVKATSTSQPTGTPGEVLATAPWGWPAFPAQVKMAVKVQLNRVNARRSSPFGVAGSPSDGSEIRLLARLDPDVITSLKGLRRPRATG